MKDFDALKDIWGNQTVRLKIRPEDVIKRVKQSKNELASRLLVEVIIILAAISALTYTWIKLPFKLWTSHLAIGIFVTCCIYVMFAQYRGYRRMSDNSLLLDKPGDYISYLKRYKRDRYILNTQKYRIYTILFTVGFLLLFVEIFFTAEWWLTLSGALFTLSWFLFCYFILMKNYIRKEESRLEDMISNLKRLEKQFLEEKAV